MEIVINIPEEDYKTLRKTNAILGGQRSGKTLMSVIYNAVSNGTPLPKGHGRLVDLDQMCEDYWDGNYMEIHSENLDNIKTIVEADRKEQE